MPTCPRLGESVKAISLNVLSATTAHQQPEWEDSAQVEKIRDVLASLPPLIEAGSLPTLQRSLADVAAGRAQVLQAGDCAEDPTECTTEHVTRKVSLLNALADVMSTTTGRPVVRVGRIAGQYAKPRSRPTERVDGVELPVYRGHLVNDPAATHAARRPDPRRLLAGYRAAKRTIAELRPGRDAVPAVWTSHEALLLDYEIPMLRRDRAGRLALTSTHWPWIGERTRQLDGPHVALLAQVVNPVACKVGPTMTAADLLALCARLDPMREPGRLTLIARLGASAVADRLPPLVRAVHAAGHPVVWLVDPMHGNTVTAASGRKTRVLSTIVREIVAFQGAVHAEGGVPGGVHLETTPDDVVECIGDDYGTEPIAPRYTTLCDPRLNPRQALTAVSAWRASPLTTRIEEKTCPA
ncbi:3-deoxy-7-phosphoheptulonate synthase [Micromonospora arborensis]|uniref:3-deoxy-7-phosphoheptulonate synthase n=1 Tax=Micromonospora arborensis TaxID=2116518 RepID=UPI00342B5251